jgi:hypothetical protein
VSYDDEHPENGSETAPEGQPLSDTQAELHEEGKSLSNHDKDLSQKLADILEKGGTDA